ncbi:MAG TPA: hypothetical protein VMW54_01690 [Terriglobia bacterium]|nr:hypothetical protein [Terriglobia bacterium]
MNFDLEFFGKPSGGMAHEKRQKKSGMHHCIPERSLSILREEAYRFFLALAFAFGFAFAFAFGFAFAFAFAAIFILLSNFTEFSSAKLTERVLSHNV